MTQHVDNSNTVPPTSQFPEYFHIVPIERGPDAKKWKAPQTKGWNDDDRARRYPNYLYDGYNGGICHKQSGTCAIDIDDLNRSRQLFSERGLNLNRMLMAGCQITSGRDNRSKLLYRLPDEIIMLSDYPRTIQLAEADGMVLEFRCVSGRGKTVQDVAPGSIHPTTGEHYKWNGYEDIPVLPPELLQWWAELIPKRKANAADWAGRPDNDAERAKIQRALRVLSPDMDYIQWRNVGLAIHDTGWTDAFDIWDDWSSRGMEYDFDYSLDKWDDMSAGGGIDLTWLYALAYRETGNSHEWDRPTAEEMFGAAQQPIAGPATTPTAQMPQERPTHQQILDMCATLTWGMSAQDMDVVFSLAASEPDERLREQYVKEIHDNTQIPVTTVRGHINAMIAQLTAQGLGEWADVSSRGVPLATYENFLILADRVHFTARYNVMTRAHEAGITGVAVFKDAEKLIMQTMMESQWIANGLKDLGQVKKYKEMMAYQKAYHPFVEWVSLEQLLNGPYNQYREPDYIQQLCDTLIVPSGKELLRDILVKRWLISVVASANMTWDSDQPPARGILTMQSKQHLGKSYWFEHILPRGMTKVGSQINRNDMNHMKTATNRLVIELAETEFSHGAGDMVNFIKAIVGRSVDELRTAYSAEEVQLLRRSVFCATTNEGTYLVDDENTRWWTIFVEDINRGLFNSIIIERLWCQVQALYDSGEPYILNTTELNWLQEENEHHRDVTMFEMWLRDTFDFDSMAGVDDEENRRTPTELTAEYRHDMGTHPDDKPKRRLATMGVSQERLNAMRFYGMPNRLPKRDPSK